MADFQLQIYTQEAKVLDERVSSIVVPGAEGYLGVWAHHAPLVSTLGEGKLTIRKATEIREHHVAGGFLEVRANTATLLVDRFEE